MVFGLVMMSAPIVGLARATILDVNVFLLVNHTDCY
jgi:hypothetical protein